MGAKVSVVNQTPYNWYFATQDRGYTHIGPHCTISYDESLAVHRYIYIRYENHTWNSFSYEYNTHKGNTSFILKETHDRSQIQLYCTSEDGTHYCTNHGMDITPITLNT
ncbi:glutactin-like isoform X2 [Labeo rohita]|uniref:Glutactin-like isoform X2 n=1 Tax=Labeo rohita TaxID=84645 RepID=A0A498LVE9_LABRO|nr:glutactin-like isoform X2 [Labeo rohita]